MLPPRGLFAVLSRSRWFMATFQKLMGIWEGGGGAGKVSNLWLFISFSLMRYIIFVATMPSQLFVIV